MRLRHCRVLIAAFLRRWGIYLLLGLAILTGGSNAPLEAAWGIAAMLALPLFHLGERFEWLLPTLLGYAAAGALPVLLTQPLWWSRRWEAAERALPLPAATVRRSDRGLALWLMLPWQGLLLLGSTGLWWKASPGQQAAANWALAILLVTALGSLYLSLAWMQSVRRRAGGRARTKSRTRTRAVDPIPPEQQAASTGRAAATATVAVIPVRSTTWVSASIVLAMRRGIARDTARALVAGSMATITCGLGTVSGSLYVGVPLSLLAVTSLTTTGFLRARSEQELLPLQLASLNLPVAQSRWVLARRLLSLMPVTVGLLSALPGTLAAPGLRPLAPLLYGLVLALGCTWKAARAEKPSHRTARWLLTLTLALAIASEMTSP